MPARTPTINQLRELVQRASRENPHLTTRLEKAAFLVLLRPLVSMGDDHYRVGAEDGLRNYEVLNGHCECADYLRHGAGHPCKHRLALAFHKRLEFSELPFPAGEPKCLHEDPLKMVSNPGCHLEGASDSGGHLDTDQG